MQKGQGSLKKKGANAATILTIKPNEKKRRENSQRLFHEFRNKGPINFQRLPQNYIHSSLQSKNSLRH